MTADRPKGPPRGMTRIARPAEVKNAVDKLIDAAKEVRSDYPGLYEMCFSGRVYPETEPVQSGQGHSDPTGEVAIGDKQMEMRDDLREVVFKIGEATRALRSASSKIHRTVRKGDFRHHVYRTKMDKDEHISPSEHQQLTQKAKRRDSA